MVREGELACVSVSTPDTTTTTLLALAALATGNYASRINHSSCIAFISCIAVIYTNGVGYITAIAFACIESIRYSIGYVKVARLM